MSDIRFRFDDDKRHRIYLVIERLPVPRLILDAMYVDKGGDDDAAICKMATDNLDDLRTIRDALTQILGD